MRPERKQKAKGGELEMSSNHSVLSLVPCFPAMVTHFSIHLFRPFLAVPWSNLTLLPGSDNDLHNTEQGRCIPLAKDFNRGLFYALKRKRPWPIWNTSVCSCTLFCQNL